MLHDLCDHYLVALIIAVFISCVLFNIYIVLTFSYNLIIYWLAIGPIKKKNFQKKANTKEMIAHWVKKRTIIILMNKKKLKNWQIIHSIQPLKQKITNFVIFIGSAI